MSVSARQAADAVDEGLSGEAEALPRIPVAQSPLARFEEYLQSKGLRNSDQRRLLVEHVFSRHSHFDADQLLDELPRRGAPGHVSRPTVYRTLKEFVDAGLLRRFELDGRAVYEHDYGYPQHDHLYCTQCRKLIEFRSEALWKLRELVTAEHNFVARSHRLIIQGTCADCRKRRQRRKQDLV
jgi:Fur family ferric uptake transcriptional regulator